VGAVAPAPQLGPLNSARHTLNPRAYTARGPIRLSKETHLNPGLIHELHLAAFYLPPDPRAPGEAVPVLALAGFRIAAYITEDGGLSVEVNSEEAAPVFRRSADGDLAVSVRVDSCTAQAWSRAGG
jgi:hypothetical protein